MYRKCSIIGSIEVRNNEDLRNDFIEEVENNLMRIKLDNLNIRFTNEFESNEHRKVKSTEIGVYSDMSLSIS